MFKARKLRNLAEANRANLLYQRGDEAWQRGRLRSAFKFFLAAATAGLDGAFDTVGNFYHNGIGVKRNPDAALFWYGQAYRKGSRSVANNIGCIMRDRKKAGQAIKWFQRAVRQNDGNANLNLAKIYLLKGDSAKAARYLGRTFRSAWATNDAKEEARLLLNEMKTKRAKRAGPKT